MGISLLCDSNGLPLISNETSDRRAVLAVGNATYQQVPFKEMTVATTVVVPVQGFATFTFSWTGGTMSLLVNGSLDGGKTWKPLGFMDMVTFDMPTSVTDGGKVWAVIHPGCTHIQLVPSALTGAITLAGTLS